MSFDGFLSDNQPLPESLECKILTIYALSCVVPGGTAQDVPKNLPIISQFVYSARLVYSAIIANCNWLFPLVVVLIVLSYRLQWWKHVTCL